MHAQPQLLKSGNTKLQLFLEQRDLIFALQPKIYGWKSSV